MTWVSPDTTEIHLEFNGGESMTVALTVTDAEDVPVPLASAVGTIARPGCDPLHTWTVDGGNLRLGDEDGVVYLDVTAVETTAWSTAWGDSEWQLDTVDIFGRARRQCQGDIRVNPTRQGASS